jgi:hypothetical protein
MPGFDRSGPEGQGSRSGRQLGKCKSKNIDPPGPGLNMGMGRGMGRGVGQAARRACGRAAGRAVGPELGKRQRKAWKHNSKHC